jgi:hypothetical protein
MESTATKECLQSGFKCPNLTVPGGLKKVSILLLISCTLYCLSTPRVKIILADNKNNLFLMLLFECSKFQLFSLKIKPILK